MNNKGLIITSISISIAIIGTILYFSINAEDRAYNKAIEDCSIEACKHFLQRYPDSEYAGEIQSLYDKYDYYHSIKENNETTYRNYLTNHPNSTYNDSVLIQIEYLLYNRAMTQSETIFCDHFLSEFPNSRYAPQVTKRLNDLLEEEFYQRIAKYDNEESWKEYIDKYPNGVHIEEAKVKIKDYEIYVQYINNSLATGSQPYRAYYGTNEQYDYYNAYVEVKAPYGSDVIVIVRKNNSNGKVVGHTYIKASATSTIYLQPNKTYQVFFYYGKGWYPDKEMGGKVKGGFLSNESFSKDGESVYLKYGEGVSYTLTQVRNGNFSTSMSSEYEIF